MLQIRRKAGDKVAKGKYNEEELKNQEENIKQWAAKGCTKKEIANNLGISKTTLETYEKKYSWLPVLIKKEKENAIEEVENALYKTATGYYYSEQTAVKVKSGKDMERLEIVEVRKFKPPDLGAMCFFLKNRAKEKWAENPQGVDLQKERNEIERQKLDFKDW